MVSQPSEGKVCSEEWAGKKNKSLYKLHQVGPCCKTLEPFYNQDTLYLFYGARNFLKVRMIFHLDGKY